MTIVRLTANPISPQPVLVRDWGVVLNPGLAEDFSAPEELERLAESRDLRALAIDAAFMSMLQPHSVQVAVDGFVIPPAAVAAHLDKLKSFDDTTIVVISEAPDTFVVSANGDVVVATGP